MHKDKVMDVKNLKSIKKITNREVKKLAKKAEDYLLSHHWCKKIENGYVAWAITRVIGVFLFKIIPSKPGVDEMLWVITGDLPSAYLVTDKAKNWQEALDSYVCEMDQWVKAVRKGKSLDDVIPIHVEPTREYADMFESRLKFIKKNFIDVSVNDIENDS